jgi:L-asparagine transporter-like permease
MGNLLGSPSHFKWVFLTQFLCVFRKLFYPVALEELFFVIVVFAVVVVAVIVKKQQQKQQQEQQQQSIVDDARTCRIGDNEQRSRWI